MSRYSNDPMAADDFGLGHTPPPGSATAAPLVATAPAPPTADQDVGRGARGERFALVCFVVIVVVSIVLGFTVFLTLHTVDAISVSPFATARIWLAVSAVALVVAFVAVVLSLVAVAVSDPKGVAVTTVICSIVLPGLAIWLALSFGLPAVRDNLVEAATAEPQRVTEVVDVLRSWGVPSDALRIPGLSAR